MNRCSVGPTIAAYSNASGDSRTKVETGCIVHFSGCCNLVLLLAIIEWCWMGWIVWWSPSDKTQATNKFSREYACVMYICIYTYLLQTRDAAQHRWQRGSLLMRVGVCLVYVYCIFQTLICSAGLFYVLSACVCVWVSVCECGMSVMCGRACTEGWIY